MSYNYDSKSTISKQNIEKKPKLKYSIQKTHKDLVNDPSVYYAPFNPSKYPPDC